MLLISRKTGEELIIDLRNVDLASIPQDQRLVRINIAETRGSRACYAIKAPRTITVHRSEVFDAINAATRPDETGS